MSLKIVKNKIAGPVNADKIMTLSAKSKDVVNKIIFERAYEIEQMLSDDDFFLARMCGLSPVMVEDAAIKIAVMELKKEFSN